MNLPTDLYPSDIFVLNTDTIWAADQGPLVGGLFRTTNGGQSWIRQFGGISNNPDKVYFLNANLGFISVNSVKLFRTTDGGTNWTEIQGVGGFTDLEFINENTGWKAVTETARIRKTTNSGLNWTDIWLPPEGNIIAFSRIKNLSVINKDTIWGDYPVFLYNGRLRGVLYLTTNGGLSWGFQVPEDSIQSNVPQYYHSQFLNKNTGWAYHANHGVHTIAGGDTTLFLDVKQLSSLIPEDFHLYQNYPNPFNPVTEIRFDLLKAGKIKLLVYNILGKEVAVLVNEKLSAGSYEYTFNSGALPSGVYFYSLIAEKFRITKKMLLTK
ncbi:MAG: T9SS type A sorting domain-containing protein [Ignavibacteria bacterium]|nr:T9SS type A sorting domain-containing protein [Ignavibacteria bacterium]